MKAVLAFARLELMDALRSKWLLFASVLYLGLLATFVWLGLRESSVLGFTGMSRVLLNLSNAVIVVFPLVVLIGTHSAIVRARTSGFCELMLTQPVKRSTWFWGLLLSRAVVLIAPLVLVLLGCTAAAAFVDEEPGLASVAARSIGITTALVFSFLGLGLWISARAKTLERAIVLALLAWVVTAALHDMFLIAVLLRTPLPPHVVFFASVLNPSEAARVGLLTSVDPELSALGPVGFWLANKLGAGLALAVAILWPLALGAFGSWRAARRLEAADLVA